MNDLSFNLWLALGLFCVISEFLLPGLVMVFVGLGALSVALAMHLGYINGPVEQLITFFISSVFYLITLRFFILKLVPTNSTKANISDEAIEVGAKVKVIEDISLLVPGRVSHEDSTWKAIVETDISLKQGDEARIVSRNNITLIVEKI